jgi:hypothetical protein
MASVEARQTPKTATSMFALAAVAVSCAAFAQPARDPSASEQQLQQILDAITEIQLQDGPLSSELTEELTSLGLLAQDRDAPRWAAAAFDRALHVVRVNRGL